MAFNPSEARDEHGRWAAGGPRSIKAKKENAQKASDIINGLGHKSAVYHKPGSSVAAIYSNTDGIIHVNSAHPFWADPVAHMKTQGASGRFSSDTPEHIINHEIGHALYDPPDNFFNGIVHQDLARTHVSKYAAVNPKEFVSEVHAAMKSGKTFPDNIMQMFKAYARPRGSK